MALHLDAILARIARAQLGLITRRQALSAGMTANSIQRRLDAGVWLRVHPGVYAVSSTRMTGEQLAFAAVLAVGEGAVASHATGLALWKIGDVRLQRPYHVLSDRRCRRALDHVEVHWTGDLLRRERTKIGGVPVTSVARALVDGAASLDVPAVEDATIEAIRRRLTTPAQLASTLARFPTGAGSGHLRRTLDLFDPEQITRLMSRIESWFLRTVRRLGLPEPIVNRRLYDDDGSLLGKVDFLWEDARVIVEIDGLRFHSTPSQKRYDDVRQNGLVLDGFAVLRYGTWVMRDPARVRTDLLRVLRERSPI